MIIIRLLVLIHFLRLHFVWKCHVEKKPFLNVSRISNCSNTKLLIEVNFLLFYPRDGDGERVIGYLQINHNVFSQWILNYWIDCRISVDNKIFKPAINYSWYQSPIGLQTANISNLNTTCDIL